MLRLAVERDGAPFVFVDAQGRPQGLSVDLLQLVLERADLTVSALPAAPLDSMLTALREHRADLAISLNPAADTSFLAFTRPYLEIPAILVVRDGTSGRAQAGNLRVLAGRPVGIEAGHPVVEAMRKAHPRVAWQAVSDERVLLRGVVEGRFDGAVIDAASAAYLIRREGWSGLRSAGRVGFDYALSFAVSRDRPGLRDRLDRALSTLPHEQRQAVIDRWLGPLDLPALTRPSRGPTALGGTLLGLGLALAVWLRLGRLAGRGRD